MFLFGCDPVVTKNPVETKSAWNEEERERITREATFMTNVDAYRNKKNFLNNFYYEDDNDLVDAYYRIHKESVNSEFDSIEDYKKFLGVKLRTKDEEERWQEAKEKYKNIYNACLLDKSKGVDWQSISLRNAVTNTCSAIAKNPSWLENWKYN